MAPDAGNDDPKPARRKQAPKNPRGLVYRVSRYVRQAYGRLFPWGMLIAVALCGIGYALLNVPSSESVRDQMKSIWSLILVTGGIGGAFLLFSVHLELRLKADGHK